MRDKKTTYKIMSAIKSKGTKPERILGSEMWGKGLRYRKHYKIKGKPDFVFIKTKIAIFCDGDFWHGNNWQLRGLGSIDQELSNYSEYWAKKIRRNIERDLEVTKSLKSEGWAVIRFWESDIRKSADNCVNLIYNTYIRRMNGNI